MIAPRPWRTLAWLGLLLQACVTSPPAQPPSPGDPAAATAAAIALIGDVAGSTAQDTPPDQARPANGERPMLDAAAAAHLNVADYLAQGPEPWHPQALAGRSPRPDLTVAADGSGSHRSLQAAIDAVPPRSVDATRVVIRVRPGLYRERVCVSADKAPITLVGDPVDPSAAIIIGNAYGGQPKRAGVDIANPCHPDRALPIIGTLGSATMIVAAADFQAAHLTVANDALEHVRLGVAYPPGASESGGAQGVALTVQADRVQLENMRLIGHQDTLQVRRPQATESARVYVHDSLIAGDVDFIFGNATLVIDNSTLLSRGGRRRPPNGGHVLAPSTPARAALGFLVTRSRFLAEPGTPRANISLGRSWDEGVPRGAWQPGPSPNGQALVRDSLLGPHLALQAPWAASTSRRPFTANGPQAARMAEFNNTVLEGDALAREVLSPWNGWAAAGGGVTGGAAALHPDVHRVRTRAELVAALKPHGRPRIVQVQGTIDLAGADNGRVLTEADFRDPALDWATFERDYHPATWGREVPRGAQEDARRRSAARQAAQVVLRVPSRTTLIGTGEDARITGGMLLLEGVEDIIVRHLHLADAYDHFPAWDPRDNGHGEWNSEYDNLSLRNARRVWVDHCTLDDGDRADEDEPERLGRRLQKHDGLLDITRQSDLVTVSWNHFRHHDKTSLVGSSDRSTADEGRLRVSFHHNHWDGVKERAPRVRHGRVHLFNNLYTVRDLARHGYSIGVGVGSRIVAQNNVWEAPAQLPAARLLRWWGGSALSDSGSLLNGQPVDLLAALRSVNAGTPLTSDVGWQPVLFEHPGPAAVTADRVRRGVGSGRRDSAAH
jgi:pectin methylesterase-like acyl-CoA thioesterase/pectate lyase